MKEEIFTFESQDYKIFIGQNRGENTQLVDTADPKNIWFHIANSPSCHILLKTTCKMKEVPLQVIKRCACLCKSHSKPQTKSTPNCPVMYSHAENVQSTATMGEVKVNLNTIKFIKI